MTIQELNKGLEIIIHYGGWDYCLTAEHDCLYIGLENLKPMPLSVFRRLYKLGFLIDSRNNALMAFV